MPPLTSLLITAGQVSSLTLIPQVSTHGAQWTCLIPPSLLQFFGKSSPPPSRHYHNFNDSTKHSMLNLRLRSLKHTMYQTFHLSNEEALSSSHCIHQVLEIAAADLRNRFFFYVPCVLCPSNTYTTLYSLQYILSLPHLRLSSHCRQFIVQCRCYSAFMHHPTR